MKVILVTGGMGFIGSNFIRFVLSLNDNYKLINLDKLTYSDIIFGIINTIWNIITSIAFG